LPSEILVKNTIQSINFQCYHMNQSKYYESAYAKILNLEFHEIIYIK